MYTIKKYIFLKNNLLTLALFAAISAVFTSALCVSYELGRAAEGSEWTEQLISETQEAMERRQIVTIAPQDIPMVAVSAVPLPLQIPYREDVPLSQELQAVLLEACEETGVEYAVALGVIEVESDFHEDAYNGCSGCYGLMQLNPAYFPDNLSPADNIRVGVAYLADCIARYNDLEAGLTTYNAGYDTGSRWYAEAVLEAAERWEGA